MSRELDERVAVAVMGWVGFDAIRERFPWPESGWIFDAHVGVPAAKAVRWDPTDVTIVPHYTTDPAADYEVLKHVRETWDVERMQSFGLALASAWIDRVKGIRLYWTVYEPGDWSRAALAAIEQEATP